MFNTKLMENLFDSTFKTNDFYKNLGNWQLSFIEGYQELSKMVEENNKKAKEYFDAQVKNFNLNEIIQKAEAIRKINEENYNKVKTYIEENSKNFNTEPLLTQIKQLTKSAEENNLKVLKFIEENAINSNNFWEKIEKANKLVEENQKKAVGYFTEQYEFLKKFQEDLSLGMKNENSFKSVSEAIEKYSKSVANANLKNLDETLDPIKKAVKK